MLLGTPSVYYHIAWLDVHGSDSNECGGLTLQNMLLTLGGSWKGSIFCFRLSFSRYCVNM